MAAAVKKRLRIFAGPNGSGKSTITKIVLDYGDRTCPLSLPCHYCHYDKSQIIVKMLG